MPALVPVMVLTLALGALPASSADDPVMKAMQAELERSIAALHMQDMSRPYFVAYYVDDVSSLDCAATFGSLLRSNQNSSRHLRVEVRVGDTSLDNTNFLAMPDFGGGMMGAGRVRLPLDDDEGEIRRQLWLATDTAYKTALEDLAKKKAALKNRTRTDDIPDFASQEVHRFVDAGPVPSLDEARRAEDLVVRLSAVFREVPAVQSSEVRARQSVAVNRYANSEGSSYVRIAPRSRVLATGSTQAVDGMPLHDFVNVFGHGLGDLPPVEELERQVRAMGSRLAALREAPLLESYNGPVLFEGQAAAELLAQALVPRLLADRQPVAESPQVEMMLTMGRGEGPWIDRIGARIMPRFLSLVDDPTLSEFGGQVLHGGYPVDDDGVPASPTELVAGGTLRTLLSTRTPVRGIEQSSGNRRGSGPAPSNLILKMRDGATDEELRQEMADLITARGLEYGVVIRRVANPAVQMAVDPMGAVVAMISGGGLQQGMKPAIEAVKVFLDGREELVRNIELTDVSAAAFRDIALAGDDPTVTTLTLQAGGGSGLGFVLSFGGGRPGDAAMLVSIVAPSLLFEELTLKRPTGEIPRPPLASHPFFGMRLER